MINNDVSLDNSATAEPQPQSSLFVRILYSKNIGMAVLLLLSLVGFYYFAYRNVRFFIVPTESMAPTLYPEDMIITLKESLYKRGDIVVVYVDGEYLVKRIVGLPGDNISVVDGALFINGKYASEPYIREPMAYLIEFPVLVPEGRFFFLGDNRNESEDSSLGFSNEPNVHLRYNSMDYLGYMDAIIGRVQFIYYPYDRFGVVRSYPLMNVAGQ
jgi:signal peptidase I